jgi:hypothetical protein
MAKATEIIAKRINIDTGSECESETELEVAPFAVHYFTTEETDDVEAEVKSETAEEARARRVPIFLSSKN